MMNLAAYLKSARLSQAQFAELVDVKQPTVHRWINGARPSWDKARDIENATDGKVPVSIWANIQGVSPSSDAPLTEAS